MSFSGFVMLIPRLEMSFPCVELMFPSVELVFPAAEMLFPKEEMLFPFMEILFPSLETLFPDEGISFPRLETECCGTRIGKGNVSHAKGEGRKDVLPGDNALHDSFPPRPCPRF